MRWLVGMLFVALLEGCIPSEPAAPPEAPPKAPPVESREAGISGRMTGIPQATDVGVQVLPLENGQGYRFRGSFGLTGTITKAAPDADWILNGEFRFRTGGYIVGELFFSPLDSMIISSSGVTMEQGNSNLMVVSIPIQQPKSGAAVAEQRVPISATIPGGKDLQFMLVLVGG